ncbi:MAG: signal transduction protein with CBS domains [Candidatus Aramenus sulfurataquae]|uniref:Signal transduction protein with CBS domains n=1 Tax=Candidatus Aramenus sulfurataquae TaxID=1326980 RepID=W7KKM0_9CREN|nr:MAG: signal transduction protein with CBS domains [Candidatus Aramenus sulfurataquae]
MIVKTLKIINPPIVSLDGKLLEAFAKVNDRGIGRVLVANEKLHGILSTRDLLSVFLSFCPTSCTQGDLYRLGNANAADYMTPNPVTVTEDTDVMEAMTIMVTRNFGALPIVDVKGKPVGIVTEREFLLAFQDMDQMFPVSKFMSRKVSTVYSETLLEQATRQMLNRGYRRLPVVDDDGKAIGMITAADSVKVAGKAVNKLDPDVFFGRKVKEVMRNKLITIEEDRSINEAAALLIDNNIGSLVILDKDGRPKGIITERDLLIALHYQMHLAYVSKKKVI